MDRVIITKPIVGICHMQVCAHESVTDEEILKKCNQENPSGTTNGWTTVHHTDDEFWGKIGPVRCKDYADRKHYMISC